MQTFESVAFTFFVLYYAVHLAATIAVTILTINIARSRAAGVNNGSTLQEFKRIVGVPERLIIIGVSFVSLCVMTKWIVQQVTLGCMTIGWWNPTCYNMGEFNQSWLAAFVVIALNVLVIALRFDTRRQDFICSRQH